MKRSSHHRHRAGYTLVFFAMMLFVLMALAAVVIDLGLARVSQRQMQSAVDAAAVQGLAFRDYVPDNWFANLSADVQQSIEQSCGAPPSTPQSSTDSTSQQNWSQWRNNLRRWAASQAVLPALNYGIATVELTGGSGDELNAYQTINSGDTYIPQLQANTGDQQEGDVVAGAYYDATSPNPQYDATQSADELADYSRRDFLSASAATSTSGTTNNALLVRMRRTQTPNNAPPDLDHESGVSSTGPTLPFLFARGAALQLPTDSAMYNPRSDGISLRATTIADARPVMCVGNAISATGLSGLAPFAISKSDWISGIMPQAPAGQNTTSNQMSVIVTATPAANNNPSISITYLGQSVNVGKTSVTVSSVHRYVPLYDGTPATIIGFGMVQVDTTALTIKKTSGGIAPENASGIPLGSPDAMTLQIALSVYGQLLSDSDLWTSANSSSRALFAPVLVNRYIGPTSP